MALNTITVSFNGQNETITKKRYQYDKGQVCVFDDIELPEAYKVIFSNDLTGENSIPMIGGENGVRVPDDFFLTGLTIYGWIYLSEGNDDGQTVKHFTIPVEKRVRETDEEPTPEEQTEIEQLIVALNGAVTTAETAAKNAGESAEQAETAASHYPIIVDGYWYVWDVDEEEYVSTGIKALGEDGTSPTVTVTAITGGHKVTITDVDGDHVFEVMDGTDGNGIQSIAKTGTVDNVDTYTITYTNGQTTTFTVTNGVTPTVDDELSDESENPVQNKVITGKIGDLKAEISHKIDKPEIAGTSGQVLTSDGDGGQSWETPASPPVSDVQVNGTSVVENGIANLPIAITQNIDVPGLIKLGSGFVSNANNNKTDVDFAPSSVIKAGTSGVRAIPPSRQHESTFYGLAKAASDTTQSQSSNAVGTYTDAAKIAIRSMLDVPRFTPKVYVKSVLSVDGNSTGSINLDGGNDIPLNIYEEFVIVAYQSDRSTHNSEWGDGQFGYVTLRDVVNNGNVQAFFSPNSYINEKVPLLIRYKRLPNCLIVEMHTGGDYKIGYNLRATDYVDYIRWFSLSANNATLYAGCTVEAYII